MVIKQNQLTQQLTYNQFFPGSFCAGLRMLSAIYPKKDFSGKAGEDLEDVAIIRTEKKTRFLPDTILKYGVKIDLRTRAITIAGFKNFDREEGVNQPIKFSTDPVEFIRQFKIEMNAVLRKLEVRIERTADNTKKRNIGEALTALSHGIDELTTDFCKATWPHIQNTPSKDR